MVKLAGRSLLSRLQRERGAREWSRIAETADGLTAAERRNLQPEAIALRRQLTQFLTATRPAARLSQAALAAIPLPAGTDWSWRSGFLSQALSPSGIVGPENGQKLGEEVALWHDCAERALILRQLPNADADILSPYGLTLEVMGFSGSYLSLSVDLPPEALKDLLQSHILRLETDLLAERHLRIFARLNVTNGPNTEEILRQIDFANSDATHRQVIEFDMADTDLNENRLEKIWLDLIFENPQMNAIEIREFIISRHPRANF